MKGVLSVLCLLIVQIYAQRILKYVDNAPGCGPGQCCINNSDQTLTVGGKAADDNGLCQEYFCNGDNTYTVIQCPQWSDVDFDHECELAPGKTNSLFPDCCQMPVKDSYCKTTIA
ncbi:hypothetical protein O0L34_g13780 [Tuta absoluta]|nr:hypothetical protein O0L34_g13780 [Tuta absoluta]